MRALADTSLACLTAYFVSEACACEQADNSIRKAGAGESGRGAFAKRRTNLGTGDRISEAVVDSQGFVASLRACRRRRSFGTWLLSEKSRRDAGVMEVRLKSWDMRSLGRFIAAAANMVRTRGDGEWEAHCRRSRGHAPPSAGRHVVHLLGKMRAIASGDA